MRTDAEKEMETAIMKCLGDVARTAISPGNYAEPPDYITVPLEMGERLSYRTLRKLSRLLHTQDIVLESAEGEYDIGPSMELTIRGWSWP